jgi:DNA-binding NarL/FixJ family response regulator
VVELEAQEHHQGERLHTSVCLLDPHSVEQRARLRCLHRQLRLTGGERVLVAEDDAEFLNLLAAVVGEFAHYSSADALLDAAALRRTAPWDLAVISLDLPRFGGLIAVTRLRDRFPNLRILATLKNPDAQLMYTATFAGADDFYLKRPGDFEER